jgi:hypothetical protein
MYNIGIQEKVPSNVEYFRTFRQTLWLQSSGLMYWGMGALEVGDEQGFPPN